ncbi:Ser-Thr-rich glycosyl-phosphatidyl-inositol-anchored membrane family [Kalmanozyma brasiliensis GHG001]|uniref:Uncharacterized protein n=1 Tax=Kalmanozyma brasiliensis (strain GHG001) TaxID=1365824 RepID=V5EW61_KALBG|nr:Ser-Thr-rich glycosyl-phosphatidyl-inositol-anchored membrane family [Kalmanozyma brasiliensis GHG001]EST07533.1 Ser-Thr-rich glycosyl-phosphatidyl-inositol-anchored membrane family [Kalmanozyma brasiliensis GHG001]
MLFSNALTVLASLVSLSQAFEMSFPNSNGGYWVTNYTNTLNWKANSSDASFFSVQLLNSNNSQLNGNFQVGNALTTENGTAQIFIDQIPSGTYTLLFVNSSNYELDRPQVYYTSSSFEIKPNGTQPAEVTANTNADPSSSSTTTPNGPTQTLSSVSNSQTGRPNNGNNSNGAVGSNKGAAVALAGTVASVVLGLGVGLLA